MKLKEYKVLGHKVNYNVTESSVEFNALDPKRQDAANDEAVANIVYRSLNPETRYVFLHGRDADETKKLVEANRLPADSSPIIGVEEETGIERNTKPVLDKKTGKPREKDGEPVTTYSEAEEVYYNRVIAQLVVDKKYTSEESAREHFQPLIERIALEVPFDVTAPERTDRGPKKLANKYKVVAAKALMLDTIDAINTNQLAKINKTFARSTPVEGEEIKRFTGTYEDNKDGTVSTVNFDVVDKDAEALGWLIKEYLDWKASQVMASEF